MNLLAARVALRPRSLGEVLDLAVPFCWSNRRLVGRLALTSLLPALLLCAYLHFARHANWPLTWLLAVALADVLEGLYVTAYGDLLFQPATSVRPGAIWGRFVRRLPTYLASLLVARVLLALTVFFVPLTPFAGVRLMFVREVVLLEGAPVFGSLGRSSKFVSGQGGSCFGLLVALLIAPLVMAVSGELLGEAIVDNVLQLGSPVGQLFQDGGSGYALLAFFLSVPVTAGMRFLKYIDVRTRKEGWDIQLRFVAIASASESPVAGSSAA